jgi:arginyl-tRNA synthetase
LYKEVAIAIGKILSERYGVSKEVALRTPELEEHGDLTTSIALEIGAELAKPPRQIAESIAEAVRALPDIAKVEVAGPGFVNITLKPMAHLSALEAARLACRPKISSKGDAPVIIEYSQPNIAKPLGVHHILSTVIGQAVANLHEHLGENVVRWNYIGDWGTQFGKLAVAMERWGKGKKASAYTLDELLDLYVQFHEAAEKDPSLEDAGREAFRKLEQGDPALRAFWCDIVAVTSRSIQGLYERLHVAFDETKGESFYEDKMQSLLEEGRRKKVFIVGEGRALIVEFPEGSNLPPYMVMKGDGATLYSTRDLAQMRYRIDNYKPKAIYIFTDIAQQLYFEQLEATCRKLGWELPPFQNVLFGRMSFPDKSMSTRKGNILKLEDVLDEAVRRADALIAEHGSEVEGKEREELAEMMGVGAFVFAVLSQNRKHNLIFTWEKALTFEGMSGPYLQYTHARARSVLRKGGVQHVAFPSEIASLETQEVRLLRTLARFPRVLDEARADAMPHRLSQYLYTLCQNFNAFYNALPILDAGEQKQSLRLALTELSADVLKVGAELLTMRVPDRM